MSFFLQTIAQWNIISVRTYIRIVCTCYEARDRIIIITTRIFIFIKKKYLFVNIVSVKVLRVNKYNTHACVGRSFQLLKCIAIRIFWYSLWSDRRFYLPYDRRPFKVLMIFANKKQSVHDGTISQCLVDATASPINQAFSWKSTDRRKVKREELLVYPVVVQNRSVVRSEFWS